jgi:hypothetical protein
VITDFETGDDDIDLSRIAGIDDFSDVRDAARQSGDDVVLTFGTHELTIKGFILEQLDEDDFVL